MAAAVAAVGRVVGGGGRSAAVEARAAVPDSEESSAHLGSGLCLFLVLPIFGICQGMSWHHLNQPQGWIGVISLSLSTYLFGVFRVCSTSTSSCLTVLSCLYAFLLYAYMLYIYLI